MNFDWTTFFLELINFFILLWILRHFLYRPVLEVIQARQQKIDDRIGEAERLRREALADQEACRRNLAAWTEEKTRARLELDREIAAERERLLARLAEETAELKDKRKAQEERERQEWERAAEQRALELGGRFVTRLLERLASPELEARLVTVALADLETLPEAEIEKLRSALAEDFPVIASAYPLTAEHRHTLTAGLAALAGRPVDPDFKEDPALLAGLRIHAGPWVLAANLRDELRFYRDAAIRSP
jgi:F-type H+-transporting ATPase subunit b